MLPIKRAIRRAGALDAGDLVTVTVELVDLQEPGRAGGKHADDKH